MGAGNASDVRKALVQVHRRRKLGHRRLHGNGGRPKWKCQQRDNDFPVISYAEVSNVIYRITLKPAELIHYVLRGCSRLLPLCNLTRFDQFSLLCDFRVLRNPYSPYFCDTIAPACEQQPICIEQLCAINAPGVRTKLTENAGVFEVGAHAVPVLVKTEVYQACL